MKSNELKVGLAVLISLIILVGGIIWGKGYRLSATRYRVTVEFGSIGGLEPGANVLANGVVKGRVKSINFQQGSVLVEASIDNDVQIYSDYLVTIEAPTVMAGNVLSIYTGNQPPVVDAGVVLDGDDPLGMSAIAGRVKDFAAKIEVTLGHLNDLLVNMNTVLGDSANQENMNNLLAAATETAETTNELLAENRKKITASLDKIDAILSSTRGITETAEARVTQILDNVDSAMAVVTVLADEMRTFVSRLESNEGTLGKLMTDDKLYLRLNETLAEVDSLSHVLRTKGLRHKIVFF